jgi:hypothetical protein
MVNGGLSGEPSDIIGILGRAGETEDELEAGLPRLAKRLLVCPRTQSLYDDINQFARALCQQAVVVGLLAVTAEDDLVQQ